MIPVSVIMTVLNEAQEIERGVTSLLALNPPAAEVIVVDGGSTDGTWDKLTGLQARDARLRPIRRRPSAKYLASPAQLQRRHRRRRRRRRHHNSHMAQDSLPAKMQCL